MLKSPINWLIILGFLACFICFFLPFDAEASASNKIALKSAFAKGKKETALQLIEIDKNLSIQDKLVLYKTLYLTENLSEYEKYLLKRLIDKIENYSGYKWSVVFTGTLCSGKTTILELFRQENYKTMSEVAAEIIENENKKEESERIVPWLGDIKRLKFQYNVAKTQLARELEFENEFIYFLDRGMPDGLAYLKHAGKNEETLPMFDFLNDYISKTIYNFVFYFEPTDNLENTEIRKENDFFRLEIAKRIKEVYKELRYNLIIVPLMTIQERFEFIKLFIPKEKSLQEKFIKLFSDFDLLKKAIDNDMAGFIDGFDWLKQILLHDKKPYNYIKDFFPDMSKTCSLYHILTTIKIVDELDISSEDKQLLRLILFFHDLGKAIGEPHEKNSSIIAKNILGKLGFEKETIDFVCKIVLLHNEIGKYPNPEYKEIVNKLNQTEIKFLVLTNICDEKYRKSFDTPKRHQIRMEIYRTINSQDLKTIEKLTTKLELINMLVITNYRIFNIRNWDITYRLKELYFDFDINKIKNINLAA